MIEEWRDIKDYQGLYSVSNFGEVKSHRTGKILKPATNHKGYLIVQLSVLGCKVNYRIHRLVAETFISNPENLPEVDHINMDRQDNIVTNLRWVSGSTNTRNRNVCREATSQFNGVLFNKKTGRYISQIWFNRKTHYLGSFTEETAAALAFNQFCKENCLNRELNLIEEI